MKTNKGYTLIEIVIYVAVLGMMSVVVVNSFIISIASSKTAFAKRNLLEAGSSVMERIGREVRKADQVVDANSTFGTSPGVLEVSTADPARVVSFQVDSGSLDMYEDSSLYDSISGSKATVSSVIFRKISTTAGTAVRVELVLLDSLGNSANFYNTIALRGAY